jgi:hypothetical protein
MKQKFILLTALLFLFMTSCKKDEIKDLEQKTYLITEVNINGDTFNKIEGTINDNLSLTSNKKWLLSGGVFVEKGFNLTILDGQTIYADPSVTTFLSVKQGAKIIAEGSSSNPIIFTPLKNNPTFGDWGGIIINGYATLNTGLTAEGEGGTGIYGGTNDNDNSGIIKYVRVEFAGKILGTDNELNGFSFNGVGSGTIVEYIQAYKGSDDGIEFFGGTVNVRCAVSTENQDDSFDWTHGWRGKGQYWYAQQGSNGGDRGIEADNNADDNSLEPFSNPIISNITLNGVNDGDGINEGIRLRAGTKGKIYYALVTGFPSAGIKVVDQITINNVNNNELFVANSNVYGNGLNFSNCPSFDGLSSTLNDSWFINDTIIGSGNNWMIGWTR